MVVHAVTVAHVRGVKPLLFGAMDAGRNVVWLDTHGSYRFSAYQSNGI